MSDRSTARFRELAATISGDVVLPGDDRWDGARSSWNLAIDLRPIAVVMPDSVADVVATVRLAASDSLMNRFIANHPVGRTV